VKLVVDASVAVKWFFHNKAGEQDVAQALNILCTLQAGGVGNPDGPGTPGYD